MAEMEPEEYEQIPWSSLLSEQDDPRRKMMYTAAAVIGAVVVGVVGVRAISGPATGTIVPLPPAGVIDVTPDIAAPAPTTGDAPLVIPPDLPEAEAIVPGTADTPLDLLSEADLMAVLPNQEMRAAAARAEWFVADFFTVDGAAGGAAEVRAALPGYASETPLPHDAGGGISYVEWVRAYLVEPIAAARYEVTVAFRTLVGSDEGFVRQPVRLVAVEVATGPSGEAAVLDIPRPVAPPVPMEFLEPPHLAADPPQGIVDQALITAAEWGDAPEVIAATVDGGLWKVVVSVSDASGLRWPLAIPLLEGSSP